MHHARHPPGCARPARHRHQPYTLHCCRRPHSHCTHPSYRVALPLRCPGGLVLPPLRRSRLGSPATPIIAAANSSGSNIPRAAHAPSAAAAFTSTCTTALLLCPTQPVPRPAAPGSTGGYGGCARPHWSHWSRPRPHRPHLRPWPPRAHANLPPWPPCAHAPLRP